jgi:hypothetical protein
VTEKLGEYKGEDCKLLALRNTVKSFPEFLRGKQSKTATVSVAENPDSRRVIATARLLIRPAKGGPASLTDERRMLARQFD